MTHRLLSRRALTLSALLLLLSTALASAQTLVTPEVLDELDTSLSANAELDDARRQELQARLSEATEFLAQAQTERDQQEELRDAIENGDQRIADYRSRINDIDDAPQSLETRLGADPSLEDIEAELAIIESQRQSQTEDREEALDAMGSMAEDSAQARERLVAVNDELAEIGEAQSLPTRGSAEERIEAVTRIARMDALRAERARIEQALRAEPTLNNLRRAKVAWLDAATAEADVLLTQLREAAAGRRETVAAQQSAETRRLLNSLGDIRSGLQELADTNQTLIERQQALAGRIEKTRSALSGTRDAREQIEQDANLTRRRLDVAGLQASLGEVMLSRLASLPDPRTMSARASERNERIASTSSDAIDTEQALRERADRDTYLTQTLGALDTWSSRERRVAIQLYEQQRDLLRENLRAQNTLLRLLVDSNQASDELVTAVDDYADLLTGNLLWIRNYAYADYRRLLKQGWMLKAALEPGKLMAHPRAALTDLPLLGMLAVLLMLMVRRTRLRELLNGLVRQPITPGQESRRRLWTALLLTMLLALPLPLLLLALARLLDVTAMASQPMDSIVAALQAAAFSLYALALLRMLGGRFGAGQRLLKWNRTKTRALLRDRAWVIPVLVAGVSAIRLGRELTPSDSGGPIAAAGSLTVAIAIFLAALRILHSHCFSRDRFALLWLRLAALLSAAIIVMHLSGQLFAAHMYVRALGASVAAVLLTHLAVSIAQRMLFIYRLKLQRRARKERAQAIEAPNADTGSENWRDEQANSQTLASLTDAHRQLLNLLRLLVLGTLLWVIWSPALPALSVFDDITLWSTADSSLPEGEMRGITLSVLLFALVVLAVTALITRHLPPLVNVLLLEWGKVSAGGRYATGMLMQYLIIGVGGSITLSLLGFEWSKVQWLVAALGVGIGFGLQEIVANFISGLIVLFERPIRVGDIIHAGGEDGVVSRINPRATVVETFEGKEVMIPNKELITNVVTNWSLSSTKLRIVVPVGVAYGSDIVQAMQLLLETARNDPDVLDDPAPVVTFEDFGDNSLLLWLRCFAAHSYPVVTSNLRVAIYRAYADAGINISFPQRDVHLDASDPIPVRMVGEAADN